VIPRRNRLNGKSADRWIAHHNGWKVNGPNAQLHADRMARENEKFIVKLLKQTGECKSSKSFDDDMKRRRRRRNPIHKRFFRAVSEVDDDVCLELAGNKPANVASCNEGTVCPLWYLGKWQPCNKLCGEGKQTRQVVCYKKDDEGKITVLDDKDCPDEKPEEEKECMAQPCEGVDYITSSWSGVSL